MDFNGAIGDQGGMWGWQCEEYDLQKDLSADPSSSLWVEGNNIAGDDWSMFEDQTPIKHCTDYEFQFCDIGDIIVKEFDEGKETLQAKRRRTLQFCPENVEMDCPMTEDGISECLQVNLDFFSEKCLLNLDGTDELPEEWLVDCSQDSEPRCPPEEMNSPAADAAAAAMESTNISAGKSIIRAEKQRTLVAFPFELIKGLFGYTKFLLDWSGLSWNQSYTSQNLFQSTSVQVNRTRPKPCSFHGAVTLNDINKKIHAPTPYKIKHKSDEGPSSHEASAFSGKPLVHKTNIHTEGGKGSITITRRTLG